MMNTAQSMTTDLYPSALTDIFQPNVNIAIWQRRLESNVTDYAQYLMTDAPNLRARFIEEPQKVAEQLELKLPLTDNRQAFIDDVVLMVDMFSCLFDLQQVGLRIAVLRTAMCPNFHVDQVPCRLICTYAGAGTQWYPPEQVQRLSDGKISLLLQAVPKNLHVGDVGILKGEAWEGNEGRGLVHCSPPASDITPRIVLTLDIV
jgi:hypothetical protein